MEMTILVFGFRRRRALHYVLEGLRRQKALSQTQVWLDGHQEYPELIEKVEACQRLETLYPEAQWIKYGTRGGITRLLLGAFERILDKHPEEDIAASRRGILVLEDDCFPAENAVEVMSKELAEVVHNPEIFSVYGHHFGDPAERSETGGTTSAFQCWGWATTAQKLKPVYLELKRLWTMAEPDCVAWIQDNLTPEIRSRMDRFPERSGYEVLGRRFCWDSIVAFLAARSGMRHRPTGKQVIFNFGMGLDSAHFGTGARFFAPPYNMISEDDLVERFALPLDSEDRRFDVKKGRRYAFGSGSDDRRLLGRGWSIPEQWGIWSEGTESRLTFRPPAGTAAHVPLPVEFEINVLSLPRSIGDGATLALSVDVAVAPSRRTNAFPTKNVAHRLFRLDQFNQGVRLPIEVPSEALEAAAAGSEDESPGLIEIRFRYEGAQSLARLGISEDTRALAIGLIAMKIGAPAGEVQTLQY